MKKTIFAGGVALTLALGCFILLNMNPRRDANARRSGSAMSAAGKGTTPSALKSATENAPDIARYNLQPGKAYKYEFRRGMRVQMQDRRAFEFAMAGTLTAHVLSTVSEHMNLLLVFKIHDMKGLTLKEKGGNPRVFLRMNRSGRPLVIRIAPGQTESMVYVTRNLIAGFLQALPQPGSRPLPREKSIFDFLNLSDKSPVYAIEGLDTQGHYPGRLKIEQEDGTDGKQLLYRESKSEYTRSMTPIKIEKSTREVQWEKAIGAPRLIHGREKMLIGMDKLKAHASHSYQYELAGISPSRRETAEVVLLSRVIKLFDENPARTAAKARKYEAQSWNELHAMMQSVPGASKKRKQTVFRSLARSLRANPKLVPSVLTAAKNYKTSDERFSMAVGALSYAGAREAQAALVHLYSTEGMDTRGRYGVLQAFTLMEKPATGASVKLLIQEFKGGSDPNLRNSAGLALGSALGTTGSKQIYKLIRGRWDSARNARERLSVIEIIGNSGDARFLPVLREAISIGPDLLRRKAVYSLRYMHTQKARKYLLEFLTDSGRKAMRGAALRALAMHPWQREFLAPLTFCVRNEKSASLRIACADIGLSAGPDTQTMRKLLLELKAGNDELPAEFEKYIHRRVKQESGL